MSGNDEENLFVAPRRPARRTNRACRHSALTIVLAKNAEAILKLAGMFLCQYQASLLMTCSVLVALILSSRNNAPHIVLQRLRILLTATIALCAHSLHSTRSLLRTARELLFVRRNERQRQDNDPERKRTIDSLTDLEAYTWTRFSKNELFLLLLYLRIPETVSTPNRYRFTGEEMLIFCLTRIALGLAITELVDSKFGGSSTRWSEAFTWFVEHLYFTFYHRITGDSMRLWIDQIDEFRRKICYKVNAEPVRVNQTDANGVTTTQEYWVNCNPLTFRIFGFIDDTGVETCRPGGGWGFMRSIQQCFYSRYFRGHGLKFQTVFLPNGMFGSVFGASWNRNDNGILNLSGLASYLVLILSKIPGTNFFPALYGDAIFALTAAILGRYQSPCTQWEDMVNKRMSAVRICEEHAYGSVFNLFRLLSQQCQMTMLRNGASKRRLCVVTFLLHNCYTCFRGNGANTMFGTTPPSIDEYLPLHENFAPAPTEADGLGAAAFDARYRWGRN